MIWSHHWFKGRKLCATPRVLLNPNHTILDLTILDIVQAVAAHFLPPRSPFPISSRFITFRIAPKMTLQTSKRAEYHYLNNEQHYLRQRLGWDRIACSEDNFAGFSEINNPESNQRHIVKLVCDQALFLKRFDTGLNETLKEIWKRYRNLPYLVHVIDDTVEDPERQPFGYNGPSTVDDVRRAIRDKGLDNAAYYHTVHKRMSPFHSIPVVERNDGRRNFDVRRINDFFDATVMIEKDDQYTFSESALKHIAYVRAHVLPWDEESKRKDCFCRDIVLDNC